MYRRKFIIIIYDNPLEPSLVGEIYKELNHWDEIAIFLQPLYDKLVKLCFFSRLGVALPQKANGLRKAGFTAYLAKSAGDSEGLQFQVVIGRFRTGMHAYHSEERLIKRKYTRHTTA
ncbi:MAG: hypothetical protein QGF31_04940 [Nitrospinota bacterium]|nr:hypothetical protein [Nitrospinota bacterium]